MLKKCVLMFKNNRNFVNGSLFSLFSFLNRGISFLLLLILANYITPHEYGFLNLYSTVGMVLGYFIAFSTPGYLSIIYFTEGKTGVKKTFSVTFVISVIMLFFYCLLLLLGKQYLPNKLHLSFGILLVAILVSFFNVFVSFFVDYYRLQENIKKCGMVSCGSVLFNFVLSVFFVKNLGLSWEGRVYADFLCSSIFGCFALFYFFRNGLWTRHIAHYAKLMLMWSIPLIPHLATTFIRQGCDRYIINAFHSITEVGLFSFALNLANIITMIGFGFNQSNSVEIFKILSDGNISNSEKLLNISKSKKEFVVLYVVLGLLVFLACYFILPIVLPKYEGSLQYLPLLSIYGLLICLYLIYTNFLFYYKKTKNLMYITFLSSLIHLLLSLLLTKYSLYFTALIYVFTQFLVVYIVRAYSNKLLIINLQ